MAESAGRNAGRGSKVRPHAPRPDADESRKIHAVLATLVEPLQRAIPGNSEVVLHDLRKLPNSIVAIAGDVTHRAVGSPATDSLLKAVASGAIESTESYDLRLPGGRELRSTNLVFRDSQGTPAFALSINIDVTMWRAVHTLAASMLPEVPAAPRGEVAEGEVFASDVESLAQALLRQTITSARIPVDLMQKKHKLAVVAELKERGFFLIKDSIEDAAAALDVSRFTIYNYLNEIDSTPNPDAP